MLNKNFLKIFKKPAIFTLVFLFIFSFCGFLKAEDPDPQFGYEREPVSNKLRIQKDDLTGAFTYEYPLAIPPGRNGLQPNLSLNYNNQSADNSNLFGYGWSMNIPYIERINRTGVENMYEENNYYSSLSGELEKISTEAGGGGEKAGAGSPPEESEKDLYILQDLAKENPDGSVELYNPEEQVNKRTRNSKTYLTGWDKDNKKVYRGRFYTGEIHYYDKEKEEYKDIDTTLQDTLDGWNMNKASYSARIERSLADNFIKFTNQDQELRFSLINYPESTVNADKTIFDDQWSNKQAIYQDALGKDIDLTISLNNESLIKEAIINNLESLGDLTGKEYYEIQFKLTSNHNIDIKVDGKLLSKEGVITSKNKAEVIDDKNITSYIWPPKAEDSSDGLEKVINIEIEYKQTEDGIIMTKKLPVEWLKNAKYPVKTDATVSYYSGAGDGYVRKYIGGAASWDDIHDATDGDEYDYTDPDIYGPESSHGTENGYMIYRTFFPIDTSGLPDGASSTVATFYLKPYGILNQDNDGDDYLAVVQTTQSSATALANADYDECGSVDNPTIGSDTQDLSDLSAETYIEFTLNSVALDWISDSGYTKLGVREGHDIEDSAVANSTYSRITCYYSEKTGTSSDPYIEITYTGGNTAPSAPTDLETEGETNPSGIADNTPEFTAVFNDPDSGDQADYYQIQVATSTDNFDVFDYWDSEKQLLASSTAEGNRSEEISYAGDDLATSTTYYWRIKFWDAEDYEGDWSVATSTFSLEHTYLQNIAYTYDKVGNITQIIDSSDLNQAKTMDFAYDELYRLISASSTNATYGSDYLREYTYNAIGNINSKTDIGSYTYSETGYANPHAVTQAGGTSYTYDNNGNMTGDGTWTHSWDWKNRLIESAATGATTTAYTYDNGVNRITYSDGTATTTYPSKYYNISTDGTATIHIFANDMMIATIEGDGTATSTYYTHTDHLSGSNVITDSDGQKKQLIDYYPFGDIRNNEQTDFDEKKKFTGHEYDDDTELYYMISRYQSPSIGRFASIDPMLRNGVSKEWLVEPQKLNSYSYVTNNPLKYIDPFGEDKYEFNNGQTVETARGVSDDTEITYNEQTDINMINSNAEQAKHMNSLNFANKVKAGGDWDYKNSDDVTDRGREYYFFNGQLVKPESFGNLHYGYVGSSAGYSRSVLTDAAGFAQLKGNTEYFNPMANYDDPADTKNINTGINVYNNNNRSTFSFEKGIINSAYSTDFAKTMSRAVSTGWYLKNKIFKLFNNN